MEKLEGRVAVVTGGADGIGLGMARKFLGEGMKVVIADIAEARLQEALTELQPLGDVIAVKTDVAKFEEVEALAKAAVEKFGAVHVLCNNAGVGGFQRFQSVDIKRWEWELGINLWGVIYGCHAFLPIIRQQEEGHIINTASMAAFFNGAYQHPYNVAKAGLVALTEGLSRELAMESPHVAISVLCPGQVATKIADDERNKPEGILPRANADQDLQPMRDMINQSLTVGKTIDEVGQLCVDALRDKRIYIFTHPEWTHVATDRAAHIIAGNPGAYPIIL